MSAHKLALDIPDTLNVCVLRLEDASAYTSLIPQKCARLQVTVPGFSTSYFVDDVEPGFRLNLTACDLKVQIVNCGSELNDLPDKVYVITYSLSPNTQVYVEYNYLRITKALLRIRNIYCDLELGACEPDEQTRKKLNLLQEIQFDLYAAKAKVENCGDVKSGLGMYNYCMERLNKMNCRSC